MSNTVSHKIIGHIYNDFDEKFGIPRQSGIVKNIQSKIIFEKEYRNPDAFRGIESFSHIWILWQFSETQKDNWSPTVRPPKLGGNEKIGVFATRSPFRPNSIGLSSVKLEKTEFSQIYGPILYITGADLMNGTPIFDIKPYLPYTDNHSEASAGFAFQKTTPDLDVSYDCSVLSKIPQEKQKSLLEILSYDPRPAYQDDDGRIYGLLFGGHNVKFRIKDKTLTVIDIE